MSSSESFSMDSSTISKYSVIEFVETHPMVLMGTIAVLLLIIIFMYFNSRTSATTKKSKKKKEPENEDEEVDQLIESIREKQK